MLNLKRIVTWLFLLVIATYLVMPLLLVTGVSFNRQPLMVFPPTDPSWRWYVAFFNDSGWTDSLWTSLKVALGAATLAITIALPIAWASWRKASVLTRLLNVFGSMPIMLPQVVMAIVFLVYWSKLGMSGLATSTVVSQAVVFTAMPLAFIVIGFNSIDRMLIEAASTMGATSSDVMRTIVLPLILPYICSGFVFVFVSSLNEYIIAYLVAGFQVQTLPVKIFNNMRMGFQPTMCVSAVLFLVLDLVAFSVIARVGNLPKLMGAKN